MTDQTVDARSFRWKRLFVVSVGITTGITLAVLAIVIAALLYPARPVKLPPWNQDQITAKFVGLSLSTGESLLVTFQYTVENHTGHDYELPSSASIYKALADGKGLERDVSLKWSGGTSLPAEQKMNVSIEIEYKYTEAYSYTERENTEKLAAFMNRRLSEIDGFTALDQTNRYEIRFPKPPDFKS